MGSKIYVGGLPYSATETQVEELFGSTRYGRVRTSHHGQVYRPISRFWFCRNVVSE